MPIYISVPPRALPRDPINVSAGILLFLCALLACPLSAAGQPSSATAHCSAGMAAAPQSTGNTAFDVADRLAILNLINSYGYFVDEFGAERFGELFTDQPTIMMRAGDRKLAEGLTQFSHFVHDRHEKFQREKIQRRHALSAPRFDHQDGDSANGQVYLQYYETPPGKPSVLVFVGAYEFGAVKRDGRWKLGCWLGRADG